MIDVVTTIKETKQNLEDLLTFINSKDSFKQAVENLQKQKEELFLSIENLKKDREIILKDLADERLKFDTFVKAQEKIISEKTSDLNQSQLSLNREIELWKHKQNKLDNQIESTRQSEQAAKEVKLVYETRVAKFREIAG